MKETSLEAFLQSGGKCIPVKVASGKMILVPQSGKTFSDKTPIDIDGPCTEGQEIGKEDGVIVMYGNNPGIGGWREVPEGDWETVISQGVFQYKWVFRLHPKQEEPVKTSKYEFVARQLMSVIAQDNGANNRNELKSDHNNQPSKHVLAVSSACELFFSSVIEDLASGEEGEKQIKYGSILGFERLDNALKNYFDEL